MSLRYWYNEIRYLLRKNKNFRFLLLTILSTVIFTFSLNYIFSNSKYFSTYLKKLFDNVNNLDNYIYIILILISISGLIPILYSRVKFYLDLRKIPNNNRINTVELLIKFYLEIIENSYLNPSKVRKHERY